MPSFTSQRKWAAALIMLLGLGLLIVFEDRLVIFLKLPASRSDLPATIGYWLGHGLVQALVLILLCLLGLGLASPQLASAAKAALLAFILSGALSQIIKHLVGRPRPRLWAQGIVHFGPTLAEGLDSFPSGHTATSVAIAIVLSFWYPRFGPFFMVGAAFVAATRMLGGSHFPLDILGGVVLGVITAWMVVHYSKNQPVHLGGL